MAYLLLHIFILSTVFRCNAAVPGSWLSSRPLYIGGFTAAVLLGIALYVALTFMDPGYIATGARHQLGIQQVCTDSSSGHPTWLHLQLLSMSAWPVSFHANAHAASTFHGQTRTMQDATDITAALHDVSQDRVMDEEAALHARATERLHASPETSFDFESLLQGPSQLPDPACQSKASEQPHIGLEAPAAMPGQDALGESSLLHHLSSLQVRGLRSI